MRRLAVVCLVVAACVGGAHAQSAVSGRSAGMGNSSLSALGGSEAIFLNPAGLPWMDRGMDSAASNAWGGQAVTAYGFADASGPQDPSDLSTFLIGGGVTNGKHGLTAYYADLDLLEDDVSEVGMGYGVNFATDWSLGVMLRILDRPSGETQVTDFGLQHNFRLRHGKPITATVIVRDPYGHTNDGMLIDLGAAGYFSDDFLFTALVHDLTDKVFRVLNVGAEVQVRPGWFVRTGFEEKAHKNPVGISLGVGHTSGDWQFDAALTYLDSSMGNVDMGLGLTGGATVAF